MSPTEDLARLLSEDVLGGIGLDVFDGEYLLADSLRARRANSSARRIRKLKDKNNVVFTPHNAFNTQEALEEKGAVERRGSRTFFAPGHVPERGYGIMKSFLALLCGKFKI